MSGWQPELSPYKFNVLPFHPNSRGSGTIPLLRGVGGWRGEGAKREKYTNASEKLQFAERASERQQQGARQPPKAACPAEHGAGGDAPGRTWASPKPGGVCGAGEPVRRPGRPCKHAAGKQACVPLHPSRHGQPQRGACMPPGWARFSHRTLERVGWGFLQAEVCLKGSASRHASGVSSLHYRDGEVREQSA